MDRRALLGIVLIVSGIGLFFVKGHTFHPGLIFTYLWPSIFVIPVGLFFHWLYFYFLKRKAAGVLIPGGILIFAGIVCQFSMLFDAWELLWPGFIMAPAVGLFEFYWFGGRNKWLLIPIVTLTTLSLLFFSIFGIGKLVSEILTRPMAAVLIIVLGIIVLFSNRRVA